MDNYFFENLLNKRQPFYFSKIFKIIYDLKINKAALLGLTNISQRVFSFLTFAILSKYFSKIEYGNYVYFLLIIGLTLELANSGLFQGVQNEVSRNSFNTIETSKIISASYISTIFVSFTSFLIVCAFYFINKTNIYKGYSSTTLAGVFLVFILTSSLFSLGNTILVGKSNTKGFFISNLIQGLISLFLLGILFYFKFQNAVIVLFTISISYIISISGHLIIIKPNFLYDNFYLLRLFKKGRWYALWSLVSVLESRLDLYLLSNKIGLESMAIFDIASKYLIIGQLITATLSQKYIPEILAEEKIGIQKLKKLKKASWIFIPVLIFMIFPVALFINLYYDGRYDISIYCFMILTIGMCFNLLNINNTTKIIKYGIEKYLFVLMTISLIIKLPIAIILITKFNVFGASISSALSQFISYMIFFIFTNKALSERWKIKS